MPLFRQILRHPVIAACNILAIALGVAVFLAMQTSNRGATRAFEASIDLVSGRAHAELRATGSGFDEMLYPGLRRLPGVAAATPMVEGFATLAARPGDYVHILGIDLFTAPPFQTASFKPEAWSGFDTESFLAKPGQWVVSQGVAEDFGWSENQNVAIEAGGRRHEVTIQRVVPNSAIEGTAAADSGQRVVLMDIGWAQEMLGQSGKLDAVQFILDEPAKLDTFLRETAASVPLPVGASLAAPQNRSSQIQTMVEGFQLNLTALSMVSMLVGVFLVYNTISASAVRRRKEIGILRAIGATRGQILRHFLAEALILAIPGILLGLAAGHALSGGLIAGVGRTLSSRYLLVQVASPPFDTLSASIAAAYGLFAAILGALRPAWEAATINPVAALHPATLAESQRRNGPSLLLLACLLGVLTPVFSMAALAGYPSMAFAACFTCVCAFACLAPWFARTAALLALRLNAGRGRLFPLATEAFERSLHRTGLTIAALLSAVAMLVGVATMVASFRSSVDEWISGSMDADIYIAPAMNDVIGMKAFLPPEAIALLTSDPRLAAPQGYREEPVLLPEIGPTILTAVAPERAARFQIMAAGVPDPLAAFSTPGHCFINESFSRKHGVAAGRSLAVPTPSGPQTLMIAAVFRDYSDDRGRVFIAHTQFAALWNDGRVHSMGFKLRDSNAPAAQAESLRAALAPLGTFSIFTRASLRHRVLEIFDQTFAITGILRTIAVAVAVIGVVLAMLVLVMERTREISILRALGASGSQVILIHLVQAAWVGLAAAILGGLCGLTLTLLLVAVVNPAFFGWTIPLRPVWVELAALPVWLAAVAVLAGLYPALKASRTTIAPALRLE